jgi:hypothetical protein
MLLPLDNAHRDKRPPAARRGEAGYALTELLVVSSLLVIVLGAILALGETTQRITPKETERAHVIREAQVGLHGVTRQLRQAYLAHSWTEYTLDVTLRDNKRFSFECDELHPTESGYNRCVRFPVAPDGTKGPGVPVIDRVLNGPAGGGTPNPNPVFAYEYKPGAVAGDPPIYAYVSIDVPAKGDRKQGHNHKIALYDGVYMRNLDLG